MENSLIVRENISLKLHNTFNVEAHSKYFVVIENSESLLKLLSDKTIQDMPKLILGEGSNVLFTQNYDGIVIKNSIKGISVIHEDASHVWIKVGAGENWHNFVKYCIQRDYGGVENLSFIPGTVGAAPIQNIGAYGVELKEVLYEVEAVNLKKATIDIFSNEQCQFGYRDSVFKHSLKQQYAITYVVFQLHKIPKLNTEYAALKAMLNEMSGSKIDIKTISEAVIHIRKNKLPDLNLLGSAGSFFKNPIISHDQFLSLQTHYPSIPHFINNDHSIKINAAWLIEQCGWKGKRIGDAGVYDKQALVLVNYGNATGPEVLELAKKIQAAVLDKFEINLEPEVVLI